MTSSLQNNVEIKHIYDNRTVDGPELVNVNNDPVVLKKIADIRELLEKSPFPEELLKKHE